MQGLEKMLDITDFIQAISDLLKYIDRSTVEKHRNESCFTFVTAPPLVFL